MAASGAIAARGSIPGPGRYGGKKISSTRAKSAYGFALISVAHFAPAASSAVVIAADTLDCRAAAYFALETKTIMPGAAASIGAGPKISTPPSPRNSSPSFDASSLSFILMPRVSQVRVFSRGSSDSMRCAHRNHLADIGVPGRDHRAGFARRRDLFALRAFRRRAYQHDLGIFATRDQIDQRAVILRRPD